MHCQKIKGEAEKLDINISRLSLIPNNGTKLIWEFVEFRSLIKTYFDITKLNQINIINISHKNIPKYFEFLAGKQENKQFFPEKKFKRK